MIGGRRCRLMRIRVCGVEFGNGRRNEVSTGDITGGGHVCDLASQRNTTVIHKLFGLLLQSRVDFGAEFVNRPPHVIGLGLVSTSQ